MRKSAETVTQRGQSKPPEELARFIEIANLNRDQPLLRPPAAIFDDVVRDRYKTVRLRDFWVAECQEIASNLTPEASAFLGSPANVKQFAQNYTILYQATTVILAIAHRKWPESKPSKDSTFEQFKAIERARMGFPICRIDVGLVADDTGRLELSKNPVLDALVGVRAADRIKSCVICKCIFWAPRINSECCSLSCRKTFNMRNSRENRRLMKQRKSARMKKGH